MTNPPDQSRAPDSAPKSTVVGVAETLESIVVAFVLAFVFRAFIVEAFVIPTGSMAVTLYGAQVTKTCSMCGYEYAHGVSLPGEDTVSRSISPQGERLRCPNCEMQRDAVKPSELARPDSGDRILVFKWPFDVGGALLGPQRWDVTVFKDPRDGTTNFIKRLVGLPGEVLEIIDGDLYTASIEDLEAAEPGLVAELDRLRQAVSRHREVGGREPAELSDGYLAANQRLLRHLRIQRKTARAQASLWVNVYNHDFLPNYDSLRADQLRTRVGWFPQNDHAQAAWDTSERRMTCKADGDHVAYIAFAGKPIDDTCAYNQQGFGSRGHGQFRPVGDLRLRFGWLPRGGQGGLSLEMNRDRNKFIAELGVDGIVRLKWARFDERTQQWSNPELIRQKTGQGPFLTGRAIRVEFINVDYQVSLILDEEVTLTSTDEYQPAVDDLERFVTASARGQTGEDFILPSEVRIGAHDLHCDLLHVVLERDTHYRSQRLSNEPGRPENPHEGWPGWGTAGQPILLRPGRAKDGHTYYGEYFMLGDNSPASKDSRLWWEIGDHLKYLGQEYQLGTVPEDQLIGKAFFVYWPAGYRASWAGGIGLIPNFGRMRWIR